MATLLNTTESTHAPTPKFAPLPFTILIDSAEQQPFSFAGMKSDSNHQHREYLIERRTPDNPHGRIVTTCLGRYPGSLGDYSIEGFNGKASDEFAIHVERKSIDDCIGTILGFGERRDRFEVELLNLDGVNKSGMACVIVEGSFRTVAAAVTETPNRTAEQNRLAFHRSVISLQQDYRVPWFFCDTRRFAEITCFRFLEKAWRKFK